jgi:hypothetical protein
MAERTRKQNSSEREETCPVCGWSERRKDCILGSKCRREYDREVIEALATGTKAVVDIFDHAETKGKETLERLRTEHGRAEVLKQESNKRLLSQAGNQLNANLESQPEIFSTTEGILEEAKRRIYQNLVKKDEDHQKLCRRAYGLKKATESLGLFLRELPEKRKECQDRRKEEQETASVA